MAEKNIIKFLAVVFVLLNVMFAVLYHIEYNSVNVLSEEFVREAKENLKSKGVAIEENAIDRNIPEDNIFVFETDDVREHAEATALNIASVLFKGKQLHTICFETPDGVSVGIYDTDNDNAELGRVVMSGEDFGISFVSSSYSKKIGTLNTETDENNEIRLNFDEKKKIQTFVNSLNKSGKIDYSINSAILTNDGQRIFVTQKLKNRELADTKLEILMFNGEILYASGTWITYSVQESYHNALVDGVNILYDLPIDEIKTIKNEDIVYFARRAKEKYYYVLPCWRIECQTKDGNNTYYFDAVEN